MPTSIPYDPSLVLGAVVDPARIEAIEKIGLEQAKVDAAEDALNSYLTLKRSLEMTADEIVAMGVDDAGLEGLRDQIKAVEKSVAQMAVAYAQASVESLPAVAAQRAAIPPVRGSYESPVDYDKSTIRPLPLAVNSVKLNVQYFRFDQNGQSIDQTLTNLGQFLRGGASFLGEGAASDVRDEAMKQVSSQRENHDIDGTLVISVGCTHKQASILVPLVLDVDKAIRVWNQVMKDTPIDPTDLDAMLSLARGKGGPGTPVMNVVSGMTFGSSFVGMVHILNRSETKADQNASLSGLDDLNDEVQKRMQIGAAVEAEKGGFGVAGTVVRNVQNLLSAQRVDAHVTLSTMGVIPSIKSNQVQYGVRQFAALDGKAMMGQLAALAANTESTKATINSSANAARKGQQMVTLKNEQIKGVIASLDQLDGERDQAIDLASMMGALDDYLRLASGAHGDPEGSFGVPIDYYLSPISTAQLAQMWLEKYFPGRTLPTSKDT